MATTPHSSGPFTRVLSILRPERRDLGIVVLYAVGVGVLSLAVPITASAVVNTVALTTLTQQLVVLCGVLFAALGLAALLQVLQHVVVEYVQRRLFIRITGDLATILPRVQVQAWDREHGPEMVNRFFDVLLVQKAAATLLMDGVALVLQVVIGLILLATYDRILLGFDVLLMAGLAFMVFVLGRGGVKTAIAESYAKHAVAGWLQELARHPVAFKNPGGERLARHNASALADVYLQARESQFHVLLRQICFGLMLQVLASVSLLGIGGHMVIDGRLTLGQLVAAQIIVNLVVRSFNKIGKQLESWYDLLASADKLGYFYDLPLESESGHVANPTDRGMAVTVRDLAFHYDGGSGAILDRLNLSIASGERVAVIGPNGTGKSTFADLLFGLRTPDGGWIEFDGIDLRDLNRRQLRQQIAVVKDLEIIEGTVLENLRMGRDDLDWHTCRQALEDVGLLTEMLQLPQGLESPLQTGGRPLSLGQAERLMLARAIAGRPSLLILDETLDNLDRESRDVVLPRILDAAAPWTLIVITHNAHVAALCQRQISWTPSGGTP